MREETFHKKPARLFITMSGIIISLILLPFLLLNLNVIIQSATHPDQLPAAFGHKALIMLPDSSNGERAVGIIRTIDSQDIKAQDMIAYRQNDAFFIEQVSQIKKDQGQMVILTSSGPDDAALSTTVPVNKIEGVLIHRIPRIGGWALFMQTPLGLLLFMVLPVFLFLLYDAWHRKGQPAKSVANETV